jgi:hypothetical protein
MRVREEAMAVMRERGTILPRGGGACPKYRASKGGTDRPTKENTMSRSAVR